MRENKLKKMQEEIENLKKEVVELRGQLVVLGMVKRIELVPIITPAPSPFPYISPWPPYTVTSISSGSGSNFQEKQNLMVVQ